MLWDTSEFQVETLRALIQLGADVSIADATGCQPIAVAALNGHKQCVEVLQLSPLVRTVAGAVRIKGQP